MVEHVVLFKVRQDARIEEIDEFLRRLRLLKDEVPGILDLTCGVNFSDRAQGYTYGLVVRFPDKPALDRYLDHPLHQAAVREAILPTIEPGGVLVVDYKI